VHGARGLALHGAVAADLHLHIAAAHVGDGGAPLAALAVEQRDRVARLQAQHLHMARGRRRQREQRISGQGQGAVKTGHIFQK